MRILSTSHNISMIVNKWSTKKKEKQNLSVWYGEKITKSQQLIVFYHFNIVNQVNSYVYIGNIIDSSLNLNENFDKKYKKTSVRMRLLTKVASSIFWYSQYDDCTTLDICSISIINLNCTLTQKRLIYLYKNELTL